MPYLCFPRKADGDSQAGTSFQANLYFIREAAGVLRRSLPLSRNRERRQLAVQPLSQHCGACGSAVKSSLVLSPSALANSEGEGTG